jgi:four helix bundle protein
MLTWRKARELRKVIHDLTATFPKSEQYIIVKHMKECSRNIPGNIAEGFGRFNYQESIQFYRIARGSLYELKSDIYCSFDDGYITDLQQNSLTNQIEELARLINGLIRSCSKTKKILNKYTGNR